MGNGRPRASDRGWNFSKGHARLAPPRDKRLQLREVGIADRAAKVLNVVRLSELVNVVLLQDALVARRAPRIQVIVPAESQCEPTKGVCTFRSWKPMPKRTDVGEGVRGEAGQLQSVRQPTSGGRRRGASERTVPPSPPSPRPQTPGDPPTTRRTQNTQNTWGGSRPRPPRSGRSRSQGTWVIQGNARAVAMSAQHMFLAAQKVNSVLDRHCARASAFVRVSVCARAW